MTDESQDNVPTPEPQAPVELPGAFRHLEESRKGFMVMPIEPAEPIDILDHVAGPPTPEVLDFSPPEPPARPPDSNQE